MNHDPSEVFVFGLLKQFWGRKLDTAIAAIGALSKQAKVPSYSWLRQAFGFQASADVYKSLNYGKAVISNEDQLNQYLYSYGPMVCSQWDVASQHLNLAALKAPTRWIDYGCGQGLAGLLLHDAHGPRLFSGVHAVVLVEPSLSALTRAEAVYRAIAPHSAITLVNKAFSQLAAAELEVAGAASTVHIFSNVLDLPGYDHWKLLGNRLSQGRHVILAVGNDRDFDGGSGYMRNLKAAVEDPAVAAQVKVGRSDLHQFKCANRGEPAIMWYCELDVLGA